MLILPIGARSCWPCASAESVTPWLMRDRHHGFAGRDDVDVLGRARACGAACGDGRRARNVARNDQTLARPHIGRAARCLLTCMIAARRHAVFARDLLERLALADGHRRAAVPGPMSGRRRRRMMRRHRAGDVGARSRPVGDQRLGAVGHAAIDRDGRRAALGAGSGCATTRLAGGAVDRAGHVALRRGYWPRKGWSRSARYPRNRRRAGQPTPRTATRGQRRERHGTLGCGIWLLTHTQQRSNAK